MIVEDNYESTIRQGGKSFLSLGPENTHFSLYFLIPELLW